MCDNKGKRGGEWPTPMKRLDGKEEDTRYLFQGTLDKTFYVTQTKLQNLQVCEQSIQQRIEDQAERIPLFAKRQRYSR
jgi:hypothetical protein